MTTGRVGEYHDVWRVEGRRQRGSARLEKGANGVPESLFVKLIECVEIECVELLKCVDCPYTAKLVEAVADGVIPDDL